LRERDFSIVHVNEPHALFSAWLARAHRHAKMVIARRVAFPVPRNFVSLIRYRAAARLVAVSQIVRDELLEARLDPPGVDVVPDGVELPALISGEERGMARERWNISPDERVLSFVASLSKEKGHSILLEGFARLRQLAPQQKLGNCRLLLAGDGPLRQELQQKAAELDLDDAVIFAGFVEDVRAVHAATDIFVFPALNEGAGSALLSAMACGLPVLAFARGGVKEIVDDGRTGVLLDDTSPESIASALARLLRDTDLAQRLAMAGRETIAAHFLSEHMVENTLKVFERLIDRPSRSVELNPAKKIYDRG
jgi:glycogen(starch) synthase